MKKNLAVKWVVTPRCIKCAYRDHKMRRCTLDVCRYQAKR